MLEAMRILKETYPNPRRTVLVGHWGAEERGLIGSRAFTEDHPEVLEGLQVLFNQDNGRDQRAHHARVPGCPEQHRQRSRRLPMPWRSGLSPSVQLRRVPAVHLAHEPRHLRQDRVRRSQGERDARGDARLRGLGGPTARTSGQDGAADRPPDR
jgi:hypothetical protein